MCSRRRLKAASKPNASFGKARLRIAAPQERQDQQEVAFVSGISETGGRNRSSSGGLEAVSPCTRTQRRGGEFASFVKLLVERLHPGLISTIPTSVLLVKHAKLCAVRALAGVRIAIASCIGAMTRDLDKANLGQARLAP